MDTADRIMKTTYGQLFGPSLESIKNKYLELAKKYHPDVWEDNRAGDVFARITELKAEAEEDLENGIWQNADSISFEMKRGGWVTVGNTYECDFELGKTYVGRDTVAYLLDEDMNEYYDNALKVIGSLKYSDDKMKMEFTQLLPRIRRTGTLKNGKLLLVLEKSPDEYPLSEVLKKMGGRFEPEHVAWMISRLCNICCYLQYRGLSHNGLTIDNLFINPKLHGLSLYGGWWYAAMSGTKMKGTTAEVYEVMSDSCKTSGIGEFATDQEMIFEIAKILLDNKSLVFKKGQDTDIPEAMANFIKCGGNGNAFMVFDSWNKTLDMSWGSRKFVELIVPGLN